MAALMNRRRFLLAGLLAVPLCAEGQGIGKIPRIGILVPGDPPTRPTLEAFRAALRELGYVEGRTIVFEPRWAGARPLERWPELAIDLARLPVDVIVAGTHEAALAAKKATGDIPIVVTTAHEPFDGLFASLARPGGNVTGLVLFSTGVSGKLVEVLKNAIPTLSRVAVLFSPRAQMPGLIEETVAAAQSLRLDVVRLEVRQSADLEAAFQLAVRERAGAILVVPDPLFNTYVQRIGELSIKHRLPSIAGQSGFASAGGLIAYGPSITDSWRRSATYVDRILKGTKPGELPVERPTRFELIVNKKTARAIGLSLPASILARADEVIDQ
jgi:putative tryptophan/tyrosine transport system substrate-binding protein